MVVGKKKCKKCSEWFKSPESDLDIIRVLGVNLCSKSCRRAYIAMKNNEKKEKLMLKKQKVKEKKNNSIPKLKKEADRVFSIYIRTRDALRTTGTKTKGNCITCGRLNEIKKMDCGHFISRVYTPVRWAIFNAHLQCKWCNGPKAGKQYEHGIEIDKMYGKGVAQKILEDSRVVEKLTQEYLKEIIEEYKLKLKNLK